MTPIRLSRQPFKIIQQKVHDLKTVFHKHRSQCNWQQLKNHLPEVPKKTRLKDTWNLNCLNSWRFRNVSRASFQNKFWIKSAENVFYIVIIPNSTPAMNSNIDLDNKVYLVRPSPKTFCLPQTEYFKYGKIFNFLISQISSKLEKPPD